MKLKFLSLFLAIMISSNVAFSQSLPCGITPSNITSITSATITQCLVCTALDSGLAALGQSNEVPLQIINCCGAPCKTDISNPSLPTVQNCVATLQAFVSDSTNQTKWPAAWGVIQPIVDKLTGYTGVCNAACTSASSPILDTCKYAPVHDACGAICCNLSLGLGSVKNCVGEGTPSTCAGYAGTPCPPPAPSAPSVKEEVGADKKEPSPAKKELGGNW